MEQSTLKLIDIETEIDLLTWSFGGAQPSSPQGGPGMDALEDVCAPLQHGPKALQSHMMFSEQSLSVPAGSVCFTLRPGHWQQRIESPDE